MKLFLALALMALSAHADTTASSRSYIMKMFTDKEPLMFIQTVNKKEDETCSVSSTLWVKADDTVPRHLLVMFNCISIAKATK